MADITSEKRLAELEKEADRLRLAGRWDDALRLLNENDRLFERAGKAALARGWLLAGRTLNDQAMFGGQDTQQQCTEILESAMSLANELGCKTLLASALDAKGFLLHVAYIDTPRERRKEPAQELEFFERALELRRAHGSKSEIAESLFHVGLVYGVVRQDHKTARPYFEESYRTALEANDSVMASYAIRHIAFAQMEAGDVSGAIEGLRESLRLREESGFLPGAAFAQIALAAHLGEQGQRCEALKLLQSAKEILQSLGATRRVQWVEQMISNL